MTTLYRLYDNDDNLLYVGIGGNPGRRFEQHAHDKPWWSEVARSELAHYPDRATAIAAEREAILDEAPLYNIVHNRSRPGSGHDINAICQACSQPISDGGGYLEIDNRALHEAQRTHQQALAQKRKRAYAKHPNDPDAVEFEMRVFTGGELIDIYGQDRVPWVAWHHDCDPDTDANTYWIDVARIRTWPELVGWTSHLMDKDWLEFSNWHVVLSYLSSGRGDTKPLAVANPARRTR